MTEADPVDSGRTEGTTETGSDTETESDSGPKDVGAESSAAVCASVRMERKPPGLAVSLMVETSASMAEPPPGTTQSRLQLVRDAIETTIPTLSRGVALELIAFPSDRQCSSSAAESPLLPLTAEHRARVLAALGAFPGPAGAEPAHEAFRLAAEHLNPRASGYETAYRAAVMVLDDVPKPEPSCSLDASPVQSLIAEIVRASDAGIVPGLVVVGLESSETAGASLKNLTVGGMYVDCGFSFPDVCETPVSRVRASFGTTLKKLFDVLSRPINAVATSCTVELPAAPAGRTLDLSRLTLIVTHEDDPPQTTLLSRDDSCRAGFRLEPDQKRITLCPSACEAVQQQSLALFGSIELRFDCLGD